MITYRRLTTKDNKKKHAIRACQWSLYLTYYGVGIASAIPSFYSYGPFLFQQWFATLWQDWSRSGRVWGLRCGARSLNKLVFARNKFVLKGRATSKFVLQGWGTPKFVFQGRGTSLSGSTRTWHRSIWQVLVSQVILHLKRYKENLITPGAVSYPRILPYSKTWPSWVKEVETWKGCQESKYSYWGQGHVRKSKLCQGHMSSISRSVSSQGQDCDTPSCSDQHKK